MNKKMSLNIYRTTNGRLIVDIDNKPSGITGFFSQNEIESLTFIDSKEFAIWLDRRLE